MRETENKRLQRFITKKAYQTKLNVQQLHTTVLHDLNGHLWVAKDSSSHRSKGDTTCYRNNKQLPYNTRETHLIRYLGPVARRIKKWRIYII
ncbi:hypothetical protein YC2023_008576 [Brassica napus]